MRESWGTRSLQLAVLILLDPTARLSECTAGSSGWPRKDQNRER